MVAVLVSGTAQAAGTATSHDAATRLVADIERSEGRLVALNRELNDLSRKITDSADRVERSSMLRSETDARIRTTATQLRSLRARVNVRARRLYMHGPASLLQAFLGTRSPTDFVRRVGFNSVVAQRDRELIAAAASLRRRLEADQTRLRKLEQSQRNAMSALRSRRAAIHSTLAEEIATAARLARARRTAAALAAKLEAELAATPAPAPARTAPPAQTGGPPPAPTAAPTKAELAKEVAALKYAAGRGMTIGYGAWAADFLRALGAPVSNANLVAVVAWEAAEGTLATWNPLGTTYPMNGASTYNSSGVRNYVSKEQGIRATLLTLALRGHGYEAITSRLKASADPMLTAKAINASDWCRGCAGGSYVVGIVPSVQRSYTQYAN